MLQGRFAEFKEESRLDKISHQERTLAMVEYKFQTQSKLESLQEEITELKKGLRRAHTGIGLQANNKKKLEDDQRKAKIENDSLKKENKELKADLKKTKERRWRY